MYYAYPNRVNVYPAWINNRFPAPDPSDVKQLQLSASQFLMPALEMYHLLNKLAHDTNYALDIREAASNSNHQKVKELISSSGIHTPVTVSYNPDGLQLTFTPQNSVACFAIRLSLCW